MGHEPLPRTCCASQMPPAGTDVLPTAILVNVGEIAALGRHREPMTSKSQKMNCPTTRWRIGLLWGCLSLSPLDLILDGGSCHRTSVGVRSRGEVLDFGCLGGPGAPGTLPKGWGRRPPPFGRVSGLLYSGWFTWQSVPVSPRGSLMVTGKQTSVPTGREYYAVQYRIGQKVSGH